MRGDKILFILEKLEEGVEEAGEIFIAFLNAGYGASYGKIEYEKSRLKSKRIDRKAELEARRRFQSLLYHLKKQGFINKKDSGVFRLTKRGKKRFEELEKRKKIKSFPHADYSVEKHNKFIIIAFDIPEKERHKRNWLRTALNNLNFKMIQQSFFIGQTRVPEEFLEDLRDLKIIENVKILEINQKGTLKKIES